MIGCVIVNYRSPLDMLEQCLSSIARENRETPCRVVLVDNGSDAEVMDRVRDGFPEAVIVEMPGNPGFAAAFNRGLAEIDEPFVLSLNTDAVLAPGALARMAAALDDAAGSVAGIAPKMMSSSHEGIIDAVGTVMPRDGAPFNRGIGQCDLGQYDDVEEVAGVCFGAALIRRDLFRDDAVGPLYEDYFLYFEDSDWCMRAVSQGLSFITAPEAIVMHMHSGVTRNESLDFKYRLIELNTLKMVTRNFAGTAQAARIVASRCLRLLARTFIRRKFIASNLKTLTAYSAAFPRLVRERRSLKAKRLESDARVFAMAKGENAWFDTIAYEPDRCLDSLTDSYRRLYNISPDPERRKKLAELERLRLPDENGNLAIDAGAASLFDNEPPCVRWLLEKARRSGN